MRDCRACNPYVSLPCKWVFLLLIKLQNSTNYSEDFQRLWLTNHNCLLFLKAVASCFGNNVSYIRCQRIFKTTLYETSLCCLVLNRMGWMETITQRGNLWEQLQLVPPIIFLLLFFIWITENKTLPKQANKLLKLLRSREYYPDEFIECRTKKDTWVRNTNPQKTTNKQTKTNPYKIHHFGLRLFWGSVSNF